MGNFLTSLGFTKSKADSNLYYKVEEGNPMILHFRGSDYRISSSSASYSGMNNLMMALGFTESKENPNLCFKVEGGIPMMLLLYVIDLLLIGEEKLIKDEKRKLVAEFEMKELGMMHYFLGMEVWQSTNGVFLGLGSCIIEILKRFGMMDYNEIPTPMASNLKLLCDASSESVEAIVYRQMIGSLIYLTNKRPDICFVVNTLSQFLTDPRHVHMIAAKHILRYCCYCNHLIKKIYIFLAPQNFKFLTFLKLVLLDFSFHHLDFI